MDLSSLTPLEGGRSGETFLGEVAGERCVVRIYASPDDRGDAAAEIDAALLRLVRGLVPVPDVLEVRRPDPVAGLPGLLVTSFVAGARCDLLLPGLDDEGLARAGAAVGAVLASLAGMPQLRPGPFVDGDLRIGRWPDDVDQGPEQRCVLVHGDLDLRHVLLDPGTLEVHAVVGWGSAHSGDPLSDLRRLTLPHLPRPFRQAVAAAYDRRHDDRRRMDGDTPGA